MLTYWSRLSHAGFFSGFPPSVILCSSPSGLGAGSYTRPAGGGVLDHALTCCTAWAQQRETHPQRDRQRERERGEARGQRFASVKRPTQWESPAAPVDRLLLVSTPECARWRRAWMEELRCCLAAWWVSKLSVNKSLWHIILQLSTSVSI